MEINCWKPYVNNMADASESDDSMSVNIGRLVDHIAPWVKFLSQSWTRFKLRNRISKYISNVKGPYWCEIAHRPHPPQLTSNPMIVSDRPFSSTCDLDLWPFDFIFSSRMTTAMDCMCIKFGVDSSSRFSFTERTNTHTDTQSQTQLVTLSRISATVEQEAFEKCWAHSPLRATARRLF